MLGEGQVQLRNLVMGADTPYRFVTAFNPMVRSVRAEQVGPRAWNDGSWSGAEWTDEAVVAMRLVATTYGTAAWMTGMQALAAAFAPSSTDLPLTFTVGGNEYVMFGRPRLVEPDARLNNGFSYFNAAFVALNPRLYSSTLYSSGAVGLPAFTGGLTVPITVPFTIDSVMSSGAAVLVNAGTAETGLGLRVDGPITSPVITLQRSDGVIQTLRILADLPIGHWYDIDTSARTVYLDSSVTQSQRGVASGDWLLLPAGVSTLRFAAAGGSGTVTASWRSAWW